MGYLYKIGILKNNKHATQNINKQAPKGKVKFSITLSEEQKSAKTAILYHPYNFVMGKAGSGKTLLVVQICFRYVFYS